ncbi:outer membrane protein assembly factor BamD [Actinobacillus pleuropneumoniae]|uniref:Outer membrane protein assembly factor BamD n=5 Tax=Actinobacillus pleuropneumoniae TaxID=715 RepID=A3N1C5_ACTP2|nr:outer membrane protein assembly factor BamD [Actinobacillus pleuropneumoniae]ABN74211.1 putative lipoprotein [Actinobacillus pleuropneumoniae serovar 5b str. L20]ABY69696.1 conserved putative lipoprotein [Actinobacillus pleuropneumoniae serovar 3 str. JL03]ASU14947.1 Outer membrane protein assembly factor BamD [Actinobacillus pleuropneumoniae]AWG95556.1 outer membrane protein assembly factor BamD [Actinobacillus pleuropneumoniae serovar 1 str. 4074]AXA21626.1 outer membrane protein assembly
MRKFTSLASLVLAGLLVVGCSSANKELEETSAQDLYTKGQTYLQDGDYNSAIRYLDAIGAKGGQGTFGEQTQLSLIFANYKIGEYYKALDAAERFVRAYPNSASMDYVYYLAGLSNARLGDNFIQDFFGVNRASRALDSVRNAYGSFQTIVQHYPQSQYARDAQNWMAYLINRMAEHELSIVKFYDEREAYVAVVNRVEEMMRFYPESKPTYQALSYMQKAYEQMGVKDSAEKVAALIEANKDKNFPEAIKPEYSEQF